jgi:hypothetical protein
MRWGHAQEVEAASLSIHTLPQALPFRPSEARCASKAHY